MKKQILPLLFAGATLFFASCQKETVETPTSILNKPYNKVCFLMTHNSMSNTESSYSFPNQTHTVTKQLANGVRGLMLDTYDGEEGIAITYHALPVLGQQNLVDVLLEVKNFLSSNPTEIVTIIFQNGGSNEYLKQAIDSSGLNQLAYIHPTGSNWPTLQTMINNNTRLVLFVEENKTPKVDYLMYAWGTIFDTDYTFKQVSDFTSSVNRGGNGTKDLYLINHWLQKPLEGITLPDSIDEVLLPSIEKAYIANTQEVLSKRVNDCYNANNHFINFLGVDFYEIGDAKAVVDSINAAN